MNRERMERGSRLSRSVNTSEQQELMELTGSLNETVSNLNWLLGGEVEDISHIETMTDLIEDKSKKLVDRMREIRKDIEADGPTDTPEQKAWEPDPDDLLPPGRVS